MDDDFAPGGSELGSVIACVCEPGLRASRGRGLTDPAAGSAAPRVGVQLDSGAELSISGLTSTVGFRFVSRSTRTNAHRFPSYPRSSHCCSRTGTGALPQRWNHSVLSAIVAAGEQVRWADRVLFGGHRRSLRDPHSGSRQVVEADRPVVIARWTLVAQDSRWCVPKRGVFGGWPRTNKNGDLRFRRSPAISCRLTGFEPATP
jgi:hypothetical protein